MRKLPEGYTIRTEQVEYVRGGGTDTALCVFYKGRFIFTSRAVGVYGMKACIRQCHKAIKAHHRNGIDR